MTTLLTSRGSTPSIGIHPWAFRPLSASVCFKNNAMCYGPWYNAGVDGGVLVEHNTDLVPWNYGGFENLNAAAQYQLASIGSTNQKEQHGSVRQAGVPAVSLGDALISDGPIVTGIDVQIDTNGLITTYRIRSQTPIFGRFSRQNAERIRRIGAAQQELRKNVRDLYNRMLETKRIIGSASNIGARLAISDAINNSMTAAPAAFNVVVEQDQDGKFWHRITQNTLVSSVGKSNAHDDDKFKGTAAIGMEGVFRGFTTSPDSAKQNGQMIADASPPEGPPSGDNIQNKPGYFPSYETPTDNTPVQFGSTSGYQQLQYQQPIDVINLDPFQGGHDHRWLSYGDTFNGYYGQASGVKTDNIRGMGMRGPIMLVGWGYDLLGNPTPNKDTDKEVDDSFPDNWMNKTNLWKTGPVDLRWDKWRKVWTAPSLLFGKMKEDMAASDPSGTVTLDVYNEDIKVNNYYQGALSKDTKVAIGYDAATNTLKIASAGCNG
jgi:hypothetical protein